MVLWGNIESGEGLLCTDTTLHENAKSHSCPKKSHGSIATRGPCYPLLEPKRTTVIFYLHSSLTSHLPEQTAFFCPRSTFSTVYNDSITPRERIMDGQ